MSGNFTNTTLQTSHSSSSIPLEFVVGIVLGATVGAMALMYVIYKLFLQHCHQYSRLTSDDTAAAPPAAVNPATQTNLFKIPVSWSLP